MERFTSTLDARVAAVALLLGAAALHLVIQLAFQLVPIRLLKVVGALSAVATPLPILAIVAGHLSIGAAAFFGVKTPLDPPAGTPLLGSPPVNIVEGVFLVWCGITAVLPWQGRIAGRSVPPTQVA